MRSTSAGYDVAMGYGQNQAGIACPFTMRCAGDPHMH